MKVRDVIKATAAASGLSVADVTASRGDHETARVRSLGMLVASRTCSTSYTALGEAWGGRHHETARRGVERGRRLLINRDGLAVYLLPAILDQLNITRLPTGRPFHAGRPITAPFLHSQLAEARARVASLEMQIRALEEAQP